MQARAEMASKSMNRKSAQETAACRATEELDLRPNFPLPKSRRHSPGMRAGKDGRQAGDGGRVENGRQGAKWRRTQIGSGEPPLGA